MEKMTDTLLEQAAREALSGRGTLLPAVAEPNDGMGLFEASQGGLAKVKQAQTAARLMKKAGTKAADAKARLQKKFGLSDRELKGVLVSIWGLSAKNEEVEDLAEAKLDPAVSKILNKGSKPDKAMAEKLAKRLGATVAKVSGGFELRGTPARGGSEQPFYQVGANNVVWLMYQGKREKPVGFAKDLVSVPVGKDEHGYPTFQGNLPKEDPWVMAARIDPGNKNIPEDARKYVKKG